VAAVGPGLEAGDGELAGDGAGAGETGAGVAGDGEAGVGDGDGETEALGDGETEALGDGETDGDGDGVAVSASATPPKTVWLTNIKLIMRLENSRFIWCPLPFG
jgi:hypothetical protein